MTDSDRLEALEWAKRYFELRIDELAKRIRLEFDLRSVALELAAKNVGIELTHLNQLREAFSTKEGKFATRDDLSARIDTVNASIGALREWKAELNGKASQLSVLIATLIGLSGLIVSLIRLFQRG